VIIAIAAAAIMIAYFVLTPEIGQLWSILFFSFWSISFILDAWITLANKHLMRYERNILLPVLIQRYGSVPSAMIMSAIEVMLMIAISMLFMRSLMLEAVAVSALAFGVAHILVFISNLKFIESYD